MKNLLVLKTSFAVACLALAASLSARAELCTVAPENARTGAFKEVSIVQQAFANGHVLSKQRLSNTTWLLDEVIPDEQNTLSARGQWINVQSKIVSFHYQDLSQRNHILSAQRGATLRNLPPYSLSFFGRTNDQGDFDLKKSIEIPDGIERVWLADTFDRSYEDTADFPKNPQEVKVYPAAEKTISFLGFANVFAVGFATITVESSDTNGFGAVYSTDQYPQGVAAVDIAAQNETHMCINAQVDQYNKKPQVRLVRTGKTYLQQDCRVSSDGLLVCKSYAIFRNQDQAEESTSEVFLVYRSL